MSKRLTLAVSQSHTLPTTSATLSALSSTARSASRSNVHLLLFPEAYLGGYPRTCDFGATVGSRSDQGREQFLQYYHNAIDLGDTPRGAGDDWVERRLEVAKGKDYRGDGTREKLEKVARETGVFLVVGLVERAGGSLYCGVVYVCPREGCVGKRRKVMPTGSERLIWAQGSPSTLKAIKTTISGVEITLAAAICWENYMPLLRYSLYSQNVNLYLAPTADARGTWLPLMRTIACESRAYVLSANQCVRRKHLSPWIHGAPSRKEMDNKQPPMPAANTTGTDIHDDTTATSSTEEPIPKTPQPAAADSAPGDPSPSPLRSGATPSPIKQRTDRRRRSSNLTPIPDNHFLALPSESQEISALDDDSEPTGKPKTNAQSHHDISPPNNTITTTHQPDPDSSKDGEELVCRGGSCIISPSGDVLAGPLWDLEDELLIIGDVDFEDCERGRLDLDVAGSYSRNDAFELRVQGLDLSPPP
ncbi:MAG: hypothetical protein Q9194_006548 [Teloschistes cf. exilis]